MKMQKLNNYSFIALQILVGMLAAHLLVKLGLFKLIASIF